MQLPQHCTCKNQGCNQLFISGGAIFMKFHLMTSSCLFNRGTTFSQTVTYNSNVFLLADTKSIVQTRTTLVNKSRQNRTFCNSAGGWITGVKRNFWLAKFLISQRMRMHRVTFYISSGVRRKFPRGAKFRHNRVTSQIYFRGSAEGTTILGGPGVCLRENTHFCAFWKQVLV